MMAGVINLFSFAVFAIFVLFAQDILGVDDVGYGLLISVIGVGGLVGALVSPRIVKRIGPGNTLRVVVGGSAVLTWVFGGLSDVWVAAVVMVLYGFLITGWNVVSVSLRQSLTPDELRGRVSGSARLLAWGTQPLGALLGGILGTVYGLRAPFFVGAVAYAVMLVVTWAVTSNKSIEMAKTAAPSA